MSISQMRKLRLGPRPRRLSQVPRYSGPGFQGPSGRQRFQPRGPHHPKLLGEHHHSNRQSATPRGRGVVLISGSLSASRGGRPARGSGQGRRAGRAPGPLAWPCVSCGGAARPRVRRFVLLPARAASQAQPACGGTLGFLPSPLAGGARGSPPCPVPARPSLRSARFPAA